MECKNFIDNNYSNSISLISKKHDLTGIRVFDQFEQHLFPFGLGLFFDTENNSWLNIPSSIAVK